MSNTVTGMRSPVKTTQQIRDDPIEVIQAVCQQIANTKSDDVQELTALYSRMILCYYQDVRQQALRSFTWALIAAGVGTLFFIYAVWSTMQSNNTSHLSLIAGTVIQGISAINFYLYARTSKQFASFHICLERTTRFVLANSLAEQLSGENRDKMRAELIQSVIQAPMLTFDILEGRAQLPSNNSSAFPS